MVLQNLWTKRLRHIGKTTRGKRKADQTDDKEQRQQGGTFENALKLEQGGNHRAANLNWHVINCKKTKKSQYKENRGKDFTAAEMCSTRTFGGRGGIRREKEG